jgi:hypothetical protein
MKLCGLLFVIFLAAYVVVYVTATRLETVDLFANFAQFAGLSIAAFQFVRVRKETSDIERRKACLLFFFGLCFWALGQLLVLYSEILLRRVSTGTVSSVYFLIGYCFQAGAMFRLVSHLSSSKSADSRKAWLFAGILVLCIAGIVANPIFSDHRVSTSLGLNLLYAGFDLLMVALSFYLFMMARGTRNIQTMTAYGFLLAGFALIGLSNFIGMDAEFDTPLYHLLGLLYMSSYFLISLAAAMLGKSQQTRQTQ